MTEIKEKAPSTREMARKVRKRRSTKAELHLAKQRMLFCRFPFHPELEEFETVDFPDIDTAKSFVEDAEVNSAMIVNGSGSYVATWMVDRWYSYA